MEDIINKLLVGDTEVLQQATAEMSEAFKNPEAITSLCQIVVSSSAAQTRIYAAVLLRKRFSKVKNWIMVPQDVKTSIKQGMLTALVVEQEHLVKAAMAQLIGTIFKLETSNGWPELLQCIHQLCISDNKTEKELGLYTLSVITDISAVSYVGHLDGLCQLFSSTLKALDTSELVGPLSYYTIVTMTKLVLILQGNQAAMKCYSSMMPRTRDIIRAYAHSDYEKCIILMQLFDELVEVEISIIVPHLKLIVEMYLEVASNQSLNNEVRIKATSFVGWIVRMKKKTIIKFKLVEPIVNVLFNLLSERPIDEGEEEAYFAEDADNASPLTCATQTMDIIALNLPPEKLIPPLISHIEPALQGEDPYRRKASYLSMAVIAEGCSEAIRHKYLQTFLSCIGKGIQDPHIIVRNAALFALGQFSEHLQPDISQYAADILPVLFEFLSQICAGLSKNKEPPNVERMFYALEVFCENLEDELVPYLDTLMARLFLALDSKNSVHLRQLALSAVGASANAAKQDMLPYFPRIVEGLKGYIMTDATDEDSISLQIQSVDTFSIIARTIGRENFLPLAQDTLNLGMTLVKQSNDPNLRKAVYCLFSALASVIREDMSPVLPTIVELMLESVRSSEGIVNYYAEDDGPGHTALDDALNYFSEPKKDSGNEDQQDVDIEFSDGDEDDDDIAGWSVENDYLDEKEEACVALKQIAEYTGLAFFPYLETSFEEIFKLINYPQEDIKKVSIAALAQFCVSLELSPDAREIKLKALSVLVPKCSEIIRTDEDLTIVMAGLEAYTHMLKEIKGDVLVGNGHKEAIFNCMLDVLRSKVACQDGSDADYEDDDEAQAERDELLIECAGDVLPALGKAMTPEDFSLSFDLVLRYILPKTKKSCSQAQRSFSVGIISESMAPLGKCLGKHVPKLLPLLLELSRDEFDEVRNNAIFGIGEMVYHGKEALFPKYPEILTALSAAVLRETHAGTLDNICGALARLITTNINGVPLEQVLPGFVQYLPLRQDFEENYAVYECLQTLFVSKHPALLNEIIPIIRASASVINSKQWPDDKTMNLVINFARSLKQEFPEQCNNALPTLTPELLAVVQQL